MNVTRTDLPGFTSVEVLAATALSAMFMAAVLGVLAGMARQERIAGQSSMPPAWHDRLERLLRTDLAAAREVRQTPERLILATSSGHDSASGNPTWLPVEVHYFVVGNGSRGVLLRQEFPLTLPGTAGDPEIVAVSVELIALLPAGAAQLTFPISAEQLVPDGQMPSSVRCLLIASPSDSRDEQTTAIVFDKSFTLP